MNDLWFALKPLVRRQPLPVRAINAVFRLFAAAHPDPMAGLAACDTFIPLNLYALSRRTLAPGDRFYLATKFGALAASYLAKLPVGEQQRQKTVLQRVSGEAADTVNWGEMIFVLQFGFCLVLIDGEQLPDQSQITLLANAIAGDELVTSPKTGALVRDLVQKLAAMFQNQPQQYHHLVGWLAGWGKYAHERGREL